MLADKLLTIINRQPDSIAIDDERRGSISYRELWQYLQGAGMALDKHLGEKKYVAGVADQDAFAVIAYVAAMLTGRVIIPLDPRHKLPLIEQMLTPFTDTIIADADMPLNDTTKTILLDDIVTKTSGNYTFKSTNGDTYVLHTSGTTGQPKPVIADQAALLHVASALAERYYITPTSRVLQFAYLSFDSSLVEIWSTLLSGGTIVIPGRSLRDDLYGCLENLLKKNIITTATLPSSVAGNLNPKHLSALTTLILAGDECPVELANRLYDRVPHLINAYGPTESIICASTFEITQPQHGRVPIGQPLPGMNIIIDNPNEDKEGEMILASSYLAKGYANNQTLTDQKFKLYDTQRAYHSGDIGLLNNDGFYEFCGRIDNQVKVNGQRIELEGVEARIRDATKRTGVAVILYDKKLYCIYQADKVLDEFIHLENTLNGSLPQFSVPHMSLPIEVMPLDLNGKINRKALKEFVIRSTQQSRIEAESLPPASNMVSLWSEVLKIPANTIEQHTNFFTIGGDSLDALRLVKVINAHYHTSVKLSDIIKNPTTPASMQTAVTTAISEARR